MIGAFGRLAAELAAPADAGDPIAIALLDAGDRTVADIAVGALIDSGPRAAGHAAGLGFVAEAVREGHLLHRGRPRLLDGADPDLMLLAGDRCFALGLERLAAAGDLAAIETLAVLIARSADAVAGGDEALADTLWQAAALSLGWGPDRELDAATAGAVAGDDGAHDALCTALAAAHERLGAGDSAAACKSENARRHRPR